MDALSVFSKPTRAWFESSFAAPTPAQEQGWPAIASGAHTLIQAPTGSGKTLAAFLYGIDRLTDSPGEGLRLLYVSPLKALNYDVERNLRGPLAGLGSKLNVAVRTGDTPQRDRAAMLREHPDILITTPESLYLLLTSRGREMLTSVETLILDEVHAVAGTKRGAHMALSVERLDRLTEKPVQRVGLSATQRPMEEIGRFVSGGRPIELVDAGRAKELDVKVVVPLEDMREPGETGSIWPSIYPEILELVEAAPLDDRLRQQPAPRRAARPAAQRPRGERYRPSPSRLDRTRAAARDRGAAQEGRDPMPRRHVVARARHRHGRRRPRRPGRVAEVGRARPAAGRARRPRAWRRLARTHLPEVPRRPARVRGRRRAHEGRRDRGDRHPAQPARRARTAGRRDLRRRGDRGRRAARPRARRLQLRRPLARPARERARHARGAVSVRRVRGAQAADRLGPHRRCDPRTERRAAARGPERGHDPGSRPVRRASGRRRRPRRRAGRGDGLRGPRGADVHARRVDVADRGDHARPGARLAGSGRARTDPVLEGRGTRASVRARRGDRARVA